MRWTAAARHCAAAATCAETLRPMWFTLAAVVSLVILLVASFGPQLLYVGASLRYSSDVNAAPSTDTGPRQSRRVHWRSPRRRPTRIADA